MMWRVLLVLAACFPLLAMAAPCRVHDPELQGMYLGSCNADGWAEGMGLARGRAEYIGEFSAGKMHGSGVKSWPWGDRYVGQFVADQRQGKGLYVWGPGSPMAGDSYMGDYQADRRHGQGRYRWASGEEYQGSWENDQMTGPLTPMARLRGLHLSAVRVAVMKRDIIVCRTLPIGLGQQETVRAIVADVDTAKDAIAVKLDKALSVPLNGAMPKAGETIWDAAIHWVPCY